nr:diguanylate cyclase [Paraburkholderia phosphatilytica]
MNPVSQARLHELALQRMNCGVFAVDRDYRIKIWNGFMATRSGVGADKALDQSLFELFPELPVAWLKKKLQTVFQLRIDAFTSWEHRPYLFRFPHDRPITSDLDWMQQDCGFFPLVENNEVIAVCVTITEVTDLAIAQRARDKAVAALREASIRDGLTGIANRRHAEERLAEEFARFRRSGRVLSVLIFDLDHFKRINDHYGHPAGDAVLRAVATTVDDLMREQDLLARYGGEEFIAMLPETPLDAAATLGERIRSAIASSPVSHGGAWIPVSASIGVAEAGGAVSTPDQLVKLADQALYRAKAKGRNRLIVANAA